MFDLDKALKEVLEAEIEAELCGTGDNEMESILNIAKISGEEY